MMRIESPCVAVPPNAAHILSGLTLTLGPRFLLFSNRATYATPARSSSLAQLLPRNPGPKIHMPPWMAA